MLSVVHEQAVDDEPRSLATTFTNVGDVLFIGPDLDVEQTPAVQLDSTEAYTMTQREAFVPSASITTMGGTTLHRTDLPFRVAFAGTYPPSCVQCTRRALFFDVGMSVFSS